MSRHGRNRGSFDRNRERRERERNLPIVDDHPREMALAFDKKALDEMHPGKFTSGYEIFRIPLQTYRYLTADHFVEDFSAETGLALADKTFLVITGDDIDKAYAFAVKRSNEQGLAQDLRVFYKYLAYYCKYAKENGTGFAFDF
jgi:hypothetical protein